MALCEHYMVRTIFVDYNKSSNAGRKTYTPIREEICNHPDIDQVFKPEDFKKINCEGNSRKCLLSHTR
jgi:hypothetical protein